MCVLEPQVSPESMKSMCWKRYVSSVKTYAINVKRYVSTVNRYVGSVNSANGTSAV